MKSSKNQNQICLFALAYDLFCSFHMALSLDDSFRTVILWNLHSLTDTVNKNLQNFGSSECFRLDSFDDAINEDRIVGGSTARPGQFPYMVSIRGPARANGTSIWRHRCGGSIISNSWILSAAQCTDRF